MIKIILIVAFLIAFLTQAQEKTFNQFNNSVNVCFANSNVRFVREQAPTFSQEIEQRKEWNQEAWKGEKVQEELQELRHEVESKQSKEKIEEEFGDLLFALINYARFIDVNPEDALERTNKKFKQRFQYLEEQTSKIGKSLHEMTLAEMDVYWEEAKKMDLNYRTTKF